MEGVHKNQSDTECPICGKYFEKDVIEVHVNRCLFLNGNEEPVRDNNKRSFGIFAANQSSLGCSPPLDSAKKKSKETTDENVDRSNVQTNQNESISCSGAMLTKQPFLSNNIPLAEKMRPQSIEDYMGQSHVMGENSILRKILNKNEVPSMILWGPPGVGKTSLAYIIANRCKQTQNTRFVKLSATMVGVNDVKTAVTAARNELKFGRKTILFMDEIHRFNKLQQVFLSRYHRARKLSIT